MLTARTRVNIVISNAVTIKVRYSRGGRKIKLKATMKSMKGASIKRHSYDRDMSWGTTKITGIAKASESTTIAS